ncbi:hypothetical protein [Bradyrhizobium sp. RDI18]|uniref:hypothetical protein n=1 Tax=Bradyrhizobium sp. RDI18 TaxID=3367400 RepID=UPI00371138E1
MTFGGPRVDAAIARELLQAVEPMAIEAAFEAERMHREQQEDQQRILDMELQQAEASLAERRYAACDPDNRLIAAQLEKNWEAALRRVRYLETRQPAERPSDVKVDPSAFTNLADNLSAAWNAPGVTMRARQQLLRTLITEIVVDVDDDARDVVLTIHWRGGQHSELSTSHELVNMVAQRPKTLWRSCAAWPAAGLTNISPRRLTELACPPVKARPGRRTASLPFDACVESMPIDPRKKMANGSP